MHDLVVGSPNSVHNEHGKFYVRTSKYRALTGQKKEGGNPAIEDELHSLGERVAPGRKQQHMG
jgi:hypothetical protein